MRVASPPRKSPLESTLLLQSKPKLRRPWNRLHHLDPPCGLLIVDLEFRTEETRAAIALANEPRAVCRSWATNEHPRRFSFEKS